MNDWGKSVIERAMKYVNYEWFATESNRYHGTDSNGYPANTPDVSWNGKQLNCGWWKVNQLNVGIPYAWGIASTPEQFEDGIRTGKYAGNVPEHKKSGISYDCVGVDCSGLLANCWQLPKKISTRDIPNYAYALNNPLDIEQGDILAKLGSHVMLYVEFTDATYENVVIIDATRDIGKVSIRIVNLVELLSDGYQVYRKFK